MICYKINILLWIWRCDVPTNYNWERRSKLISSLAWSKAIGYQERKWKWPIHGLDSYKHFVWCHIGLLVFNPIKNKKQWAIRGLGKQQSLATRLTLLAYFGFNLGWSFEPLDGLAQPILIMSTLRGLLFCLWVGPNPDFLEREIGFLSPISEAWY